LHFGHRGRASNRKRPPLPQGFRALSTIPFSSGLQRHGMAESGDTLQNHDEPPP
jgi:hypothetical protein